MRYLVLGTTDKVCQKKKLTEEDALVIIMKRWAKPKKGKGEKNYYYCKQCDAFHTTSL